MTAWDTLNTCPTSPGEDKGKWVASFQRRQMARESAQTERLLFCSSSHSKTDKLLKGEADLSPTSSVLYNLPAHAEGWNQGRSSSGTGGSSFVDHQFYFFLTWHDTFSHLGQDRVWSLLPSSNWKPWPPPLLCFHRQQAMWLMLPQTDAMSNTWVREGKLDPQPNY